MPSIEEMTVLFPPQNEGGEDHLKHEAVVFPTSKHLIFSQILFGIPLFTLNYDIASFCLSILHRESNLLLYLLDFLNALSFFFPLFNFNCVFQRIVFSSACIQGCRTTCFSSYQMARPSRISKKVVYHSIFFLSLHSQYIT